MGYLIAGLPIITDGYYAFQADLIEQFNAGIILDPAKPEQLIDNIIKANWSDMCEGVRRLRSYMHKHNKSVIDGLSVVLARSQQRRSA